MNFPTKDNEDSFRRAIQMLNNYTDNDDDQNKAYIANQKAIVGRYPPQVYSHHPPISFGMLGTSPSGNDGYYEYQEPERDEQGSYYGYKILRWDQYRQGFTSLHYPVMWTDGMLKSLVEPDEDSMFGIHFVKRPDHPGLEDYWAFAGMHGALVRCALGGTVVEREQGFRAQYALIVGVFCNGRWISYQEYISRRGRSENYSYEEWERNPDRY